MVGLHKVSRIVVLGSLLLAGTGVQAMDKLDPELTQILARRKEMSEPQLTPSADNKAKVPAHPLPFSPFMSLITSDPFKAILNNRGRIFMNSSKELRKSLRPVNKALKKFIDDQRQSVRIYFKSHYDFAVMCNWLIAQENLKKMVLSESGASDKHVSSLKGLLELKLFRENNITDELFKKLTNLTSLSLDGMNNIKEVSKLTALTSLTLNGRNNIFVNELTSLTSLSLDRMNNIKGVNKLTTLKNLSLDSMNNIKGMNKLTNLKSLQLFMVTDDRGWEELNHLTNLTELRLISINISGSCFSHLPKLETVTLSEVPIEEGELANLSSLKKIEIDTMPAFTGSSIKNLPSLTHTTYEGRVIRAEPGHTLSQQQRDDFEKNIAAYKTEH